MTEATKHFSIMVKEYRGKEFELCKVRSHPWDIVRALKDKTPRYKTIEVSRPERRETALANKAPSQITSRLDLAASALAA